MRKNYSLFELSNEIKQALRLTMPQTYMLAAEISEMRESGAHAFLELVDKDDIGKTIAKASANIWAYTYRMLKPYFETTTGRNLGAGIKILVEVSVEFNEIYGYSLNIKDIDPTYTIGDIEKRRMQVIKELEENGVIDMNKELEIVEVPQRIAIISSETAAGYDDFINQLINNYYGFKFHVKLFPAIMQGEKAEDSIVAAFDSIYNKQSEYDVVVLIRGGGAKSDLECFDNYWLAYNIAQFPLPVISGLGHERDLSVADIVSNTSVKTPTAVAQILIDKLAEFNNLLDALEENLKDIVSDKLFTKSEELKYFTFALKPSVYRILQYNESELNFFEMSCKNSVRNYISYQKRFIDKQTDSLNFAVKNVFSKKISNIENKKNELNFAVRNYFEHKKHFLEISAQKNILLSPKIILERGYSFTQVGGKLLKSASQVKKGDLIFTTLSDGKFSSVVE